MSRENAAGVLVLLLLAGCVGPYPGPDKQGAGLVQGAAVGAGAGAVTGSQLAAGTGPGALVGAGVGAVAGSIQGFAKDLASGREQEFHHLGLAHLHHGHRQHLAPTNILQNGAGRRESGADTGVHPDGGRQ